MLELVVAGLLQDDERHGAVVVDLRELGGEVMVQHAQRREEAQTHVLRREMEERLLETALVLGADRPDRQAVTIAQLDRTFELARIGADGETLLARR